MENKIDRQGDVVLMQVLRNSTGETFTVKCDAEDLPMLQSHYWVMDNKVHSITCNFRKDGKTVKPTLHRMLIGAKFVDFLNGDKFDFRKSNLEPVSWATKGNPVGFRLKGNPYFMTDDTVTFWTTNRKGEKIGQFLIDRADFELVNQYTWNINKKTGYVQAKTREGAKDSKGVYLHRLIMNAGPDDLVDHINRIRTDNQRANLRLCSNSENVHNSERIREESDTVHGVIKVPPTWYARMMVNRKNLVKYCRSKEDAIRQRKEWEAIYGVERAANKNCASGCAGIYCSKPKWTAEISVNGKTLRKQFISFDKALAQRKAWEEEYNPSGLN